MILKLLDFQQLFKIKLAFILTYPIDFITCTGLQGLPKWRDVDLNTGVAILHETKNGERRLVPITGFALELLKDYSKVRRIDTPLLFPSAIKPQQPIDLKKAWNNAIKKAGIEGFNWHDLRHTFASYLGYGWRNTF
jgi:integrase